MSSPDEATISHGAKFASVIDRGGLNRTGKIYDEEGKICWQYWIRTNSNGRRWQNPLNKPDFVFANTDGQAEIVIRRVSFMPSVFQMMDHDHLIGVWSMGPDGESGSADDITTADREGPNYAVNWEPTIMRVLDAAVIIR